MGNPAVESAPVRSDLLHSIYEAAFESCSWQLAMQGVGELVGATSGFLFSAPDIESPSMVAEQYGIGEAMVREHYTRWHTEDPWKLGAIRTGQMVRNTVVTGEELVPHAAFLHSAFYNDFVRHYEIERIAGSIVFDEAEPDGMPFTNLCWYRPPGSAPFDEAAKATIRTVLPHFQNALRLKRHMRSVTEPYTASATFAALNIAYVVFDDELRVLQTNEAGRALLGSSASGACRHGKVQFVGARCSPELRDARRLCDQGEMVRLVVRLAGEGSEVVSASMVALPDAPTALSVDAGSRYLLMVEMKLGGGVELAKRVAGLFDLSAAEVRVLSQLLDGHTASEVATRLVCALPTVRTHIRSIFMKTGVTRQIDLIRALRGIRT